MDKVLVYIKRVPLLLAVVAIGTALIFMRVFKTYDVLAAAFLRLFLASGMACFLYLISGTKTFLEKRTRVTQRPPKMPNAPA